MAMLVILLILYVQNVIADVRIAQVPITIIAKPVLKDIISNIQVIATDVIVDV
jgi:hypothetical protein